MTVIDVFIIALACFIGSIIFTLVLFKACMDDVKHLFGIVRRHEEAIDRHGIAFVQNDERFAAISQSIVDLNRINATLRDAIEAKGDRLTDLEAKFGAAEELISNAAELTEIQASTEKLMRDGLQSIMNYDVYEARKDK